MSNNWETIETTAGGWAAQLCPDSDPFPPDEPGDDVSNGCYLTTTDNRYFARNTGLLRDEDEAVACWSFPLYMYAHSGVALSLGREYFSASRSEEYPFNCQWDSGQVGFVRVRKQGCGFDSEEQARAAAEASVAAWNQYLSGDIWGYRILGPGGEAEDDIADECWGFYGRDYAEREARAALVRAAAERAEEESAIALVWAE